MNARVCAPESAHVDAPAARKVPGLGACEGEPAQARPRTLLPTPRLCRAEAVAAAEGADFIEDGQSDIQDLVVCIRNVLPPHGKFHHERQRAAGMVEAVALIPLVGVGRALDARLAQ